MDPNTNDVSPELAEMAKTAKTEEGLQALAQEEGHEFSDEQLEGIAGGRENGTQILIHRMARGNYK